MTGPARITIELQPPTRRRERWVTRTRVEEPTQSGSGWTTTAGVGRPSERGGWAFPSEPRPAPEQREPAVVPLGYEPPADCTCLDGFCDADHANE